MYEYIDKNIEEIKRKVKAYFRNARLGLLKYDELNKSQIDEEVDKIFDKSLSLNDALLEGIIKDMDLSEDDYPIPMLNDRYNPTTKYVFANEFERKRDRYKEAIISSIYGIADNQGRRKDFNQLAVITALSSLVFLKLQNNNARILAQQIEECAVDDERFMFLREGIRNGVEYVRWITAEDERVCNECGSYHNKIFPIDEVPERPHYGCRCEMEYITEELLEEIEDIEDMI